MRRLAALTLCAALGCSNGVAEPRPTSAPSQGTTSVTPTATPTPAPTTPSPSPSAPLPEWTQLDGICENVSDDGPPLLPPIAAHVLGVEETVSRGTRYSNADFCEFVPPRAKTPFASVMVGEPKVSTWDTHAKDASRVDEPSLPGDAYSFAENGGATVVLRLAAGELSVSVRGLGAGDRAAAVRFARILLALAWEEG